MNYFHVQIEFYRRGRLQDITRYIKTDMNRTEALIDQLEREAIDLELISASISPSCKFEYEQEHSQI